MNVNKTRMWINLFLLATVVFTGVLLVAQQAQYATITMIMACLFELILVELAIRFKDDGKLR